MRLNIDVDISLDFLKYKNALKKLLIYIFFIKNKNILSTADKLNNWLLEEMKRGKNEKGNYSTLQSPSVLSLHLTRIMFYSQGRLARRRGRRRSN